MSVLCSQHPGVGQWRGIATPSACLWPHTLPWLAHHRHYQAWRLGTSRAVPLEELCDVVHRSFFELCVQNQGRPAAAALLDLVRAAVEAFDGGVTMAQLALQLSLERSDWSVDVAGARVTASEKSYRQQWLDTVYITLQLSTRDAGSEAFAAVAPLRPLVPEDEWLVSIVDRVLTGQATGEQQLAVQFDRAISTGGASGGAASAPATISPQFIPISQLVLLTMKVRNELRHGGAGG